jgi:hypothetical protein
MTTDTLNNLLRNKHPNGYDSRDSFTIPTHPELNRIAIRQGVDAEYLLWAVLRHYVAQCDGSSHFTRQEVYTIALEHGLSWTRRHFNRVLEAGNHIFWTVGKVRLFLRSFRKVYNALADETAAAIPSARFVMIQPNKSAAERRAEFYWSWFVSRGESTIARDTLADLFGLSHDQQRAYEKLLGPRMKINTNYCHIDADLYKKDLKNIPGHAYSFIQEKFNDNRIEQVNVIAYQLPNTFTARESRSDESSSVFAPNRALKASRTLYRLDSACSNNERWYFNFYDEWEQHMNPKAYIRSYYQGKKRIWRSGQFF